MPDFIAGACVGAMFVILALAGVQGGRDASRQKERSQEACKPSTVLSVSNGVATCFDGRVYMWREGYLQPVERR